MGTAHVDTFARDHLPARSAWPDLPLGELRYPARLNAAAALVGDSPFADHACVIGLRAAPWFLRTSRSEGEEKSQCRCRHP